MKRSELEPGMWLEIKRGRDYPDFTRDVMLLDDRIWCRNEGWAIREGAPPVLPADEIRGYRRHLTSGYPVAVKTNRSEYDEEIDDWVSTGTFWEGKLIRGQDLMPVGTADAYQVEQDAARERKNTRDQERQVKLDSLKQRSGVKGLRYATGWQNIDYLSVTLSIEDFEELISRLTHDDPES